jgi:3-oxoacyl-[acyl-carrier protein] reductase
MTEQLNLSLAGKVALVTGASRGIGRAIALRFAKAGADVAIIYRKSEKEAQQTLAEIKKMGVRAGCWKCDAADQAESFETVQAVLETFGQIHILVNNVAISDNIPFFSLEPDQWKRAMDVNINSLYNFSWPVLHHMREEKRGKVLNINSVCGVRTIAAVPVHYATTKGAMTAFTWTLAREVARYGISINGLAPGLVKTEFAAGLPAGRIRDFERFCPAGRIGNPEEIADFATWLVSDFNSYMTGETVVVSGGL